MLWQSVARARPGSTVNVLSDIAHAALHWHEEGHRHHDDGSYTLDESTESVHHLMADHLSICAALVTATGHAFPPSLPLLPRSLGEAPVPAPFLDGLLRPPRPRA